MMGRSEIKAAQKLVEMLDLPLTAEEAKSSLRAFLDKKFPDSQLLPGWLMSTNIMYTDSSCVFHLKEGVFFFKKQQPMSRMGLEKISVGVTVV